MVSLQNIFYGNYEPQFDTIRETAEVNRVMDEMEELERQLKEVLDGDGQTLLIELLRNESELRYMAFADYYAEGFYLAVSMLQSGRARKKLQDQNKYLGIRLRRIEQAL